MQIWNKRHSIYCFQLIYGGSCGGNRSRRETQTSPVILSSSWGSQSSARSERVHNPVSKFWVCLRVSFQWNVPGKTPEWGPADSFKYRRAVLLWAPRWWQRSSSLRLSLTALQQTLIPAPSRILFLVMSHILWSGEGWNVERSEHRELCLSVQGQRGAVPSLLWTRVWYLDPASFLPTITQEQNSQILKLL